MYLIRLDVDEKLGKPIIIPQYNNKISIRRSKHDENRLVISDKHNSWEFNKFDILTGIGIMTNTIDIEDLKYKYKNKSKSKVKKHLKKFIKLSIRMLKKLLDYVN